MPATTSGRRIATQRLPTLGGFRWLRWLLALVFGGTVIAAAVASAVYLVYVTDPDLPRLDRASDYHPKLVTKIYARGGELIGEIFEERRTVVTREQIPDTMIHALVDAEDAEFYEHHGLSYWGMARALINDFKPGAHIQGASTLTQQLVRNLLLKSNAKTLKRKVQEAILARRIETQLSKDEILTLYLNQIELPYQRFGVDEAARFYFGKSVKDVDAGEAALLASLPKGGNIDPLKHPDRAKDRQRYVLSQMVRYHHLDAAAAARFANAPIKLVKNGGTPYLGIAPEYVDQVAMTLIERFGQKKLPYLGVEVHTRCDAKIQKAAHEAVAKGLIDLDARQGYRKPLARLKPPEQKKQHQKLAKEFPAQPSKGAVVDGLITEIIGGETPGAVVDLGGVTGYLPLPIVVDRYNPKALSAGERFAAGDVIRVSVIEDGDKREDGKPTLALKLGPEAAAVVIDPATRDVVALVGGYAYHAGNFRPGPKGYGYYTGGLDRALDAKRQPGSAFKPFVYASALDTGRFTAASVLVDGPQVYTSQGMQPWKPKNSEKEEYLGPVRLRVALAKSLNTVASQLVDVERDGIDPVTVATLAKSLGVESKLEANPSLALGTSEVTPFEITSAYAALAAGGKAKKPRFIDRIVAPSNAPPTDTPLPSAPEPEAPEVEVLRPEIAFLVTSMMTSVVDFGTAAAAKGKLGRPIAGKTGTTNSHKDAWFVGFSADLVAGVWVGFDESRELGHGEQGARAALPIWIALMTDAEQGLPPRPFEPPPGVVSTKIDPASGLLAAPGASNGLDEWFLEGTQPTTEAPKQGEASPDTYLLDSN